MNVFIEKEKKVKFTSTNFEREKLMLITFVRAIILYTIVLIVMRMMGKREIGQLQPFELAISIMIADLASVPMTELGIPLTNGIIPILGLLVMDLLISWLNMKSINFRKLLCGKPSILVYRGKIDEAMLKKERFTVNELQERLRGDDVFDIADVEYAILETNGEISVITKPEKRSVTTEDLKLDVAYDGIPYDLVVDGKIMYENLKRLGKDQKWLETQLKKFHAQPNDVLLATINGKQEIFCQKKEERK